MLSLGCLVRRLQHARLLTYDVYIHTYMIVLCVSRML